jgi:hypothetical protein
MKRLLMVAACLMAGAVWAQPPPPTASGRSVTLWTEPLGPLLLGSFYAANRDTYLMVPLGANVPLSRELDLVLELTPIWIRQDCEGPCKSQALALGVGTAWTPQPNTSGGGFFLQPKLVGVLARDTGVDNEVWTTTRGQLSVGLDLGYRLNFDRLFLAFVLGGSVGMGWNVQESTPSIFFSLMGWPERRSVNKAVWDLNVHLVRIGASF